MFPRCYPVAHPPRTPLVLRVGVTGHRPDDDKGRGTPDPQQLNATITEILQHIRDAVEGVANTSAHIFDLNAVPNHLRVVSALAEGADQWIAEVAVRLDYELQCPLPFQRDEYANDFPDPAKYQELLKQASAILELDGQVSYDQGKRTPSSAAYEAVGHAVLNQSDLLLAVWDGNPPQGRGGTGAVVAEALQRGIPVIWVTWAAPEKWIIRLPAWRLLKHPADIEGDAERLKIQVQQLLLPPPETDSSEHVRFTTRREEYFSETQKYGNAIHGWWAIFVSLVTGEIFNTTRLADLFKGKPFRVENFEREARSEWDSQCLGTFFDPKQSATHDQKLSEAIDSSYFRHYSWANGLSVYYANLYRSAFVIGYLLAAAAVFLALFGWASHFPFNHDIFVWLELVTIVTILGLTTWGRRKRWHERSIDFRMLAERLRLARCLALFGGGGQQISLAPHLATYGNPTATWMHWHYQAIERGAGLANVEFTAQHLAASREFWQKSLIENQIDYHTRTSDRHKKLDRRVHRIGVALFALTFLACLLHLCPYMTSIESWLIFAAAFLPALGAALAAIRTQAEAQRLSRRSHAMMQSLVQLRLEFASMPTRDGEGNSQRLRARADRVTELMVREMLDWRVVVLDQPLETHI